MSKHVSGEVVDNSGSNKKQKIDKDNKEEDNQKEDDAEVDTVKCSECLHTPCLWNMYGNQVKRRISEAMEELEANVAELNKRRSKARNAGYVLMNQLYRGHIGHRRELPQCIVDAVRQFMPVVDGNAYTGFKK